MKISIVATFLFCFLMMVGCTILKNDSDKNTFFPSNPCFHYEGRYDFENKDKPTFSFPGVSFSFRFKGSKSCVVKLKTKAFRKKDYYMVTIDNQEPFLLKTYSDSLAYLLSNDLDTNREHTIEVFKRTEGSIAKGTFLGIELDVKGELLPWIKKKDLQIEFIGNSITCGYGNEGADQHCKFSAETENNYSAFGAIVARKLNAEYMAVAASGYGLIRSYQNDHFNIMPRFYDYVHVTDTNHLKKYVNPQWNPKFTIINLGTNDFARGIPDSATFVTKYVQFIEQIKKKHSQTKIVCLTGPMMNDRWPRKVKALSRLKNYIYAVVKEANKQYENDIFSFSMTEQKDMGYGCSWHPSLVQHAYNAEELYAFLLPLMNQ